MQNSKLAKTHQSACAEMCPVALTSQLIERKWMTLIIRELLMGTKRFSELEKALGSISAKVLAERLKEMERNQLLVRKVYPSVPPTTEYTLTAMGMQLESVIKAMAEFGAVLAAHNQTKE